MNSETVPLLPMFREVAILTARAVQSDLIGASERMADGTLARVATPLDRLREAIDLGGPFSMDAATSLSAYALSTKQVVSVHDLVTESHFEDVSLREWSVRSAAAVPIVVAGEAVGTLEWYRYQVHGFGKNHLRLFRLLARQCEALIRTVRHSQELLSRQSDDAKMEKSVEDLRSSPRRRYPYRQMIAPVAHGDLPKPEEFFPVWCKDLSGGGFSLYLNSPPSFQELVVSLGPLSYQKHLRAEVVHARPIKYNGRDVYLVGCRFLDYVEFERTLPNP